MSEDKQKKAQELVDKLYRDRRERNDKLRRKKYDETKDRLKNRFRGFTTSRSVTGSAEIGTADDGYKAAQEQQLRDIYERRTKNYSGTVIDPTKPTTGVKKISI